MATSARNDTPPLDTAPRQWVAGLLGRAALDPAYTLRFTQPTITINMIAVCAYSTRT